MSGCVEMLCGVSVFRGVAATDMPTREADPEMHPRVAHFNAILADRAMRLQILSLLDVFTRVHLLRPSLQPQAAAGP
jgi:hypothetical protein